VSPFSLAPEQFMARTYSDIGLTDHSSLRELTVKGLLGEVFYGKPFVLFEDVL
jgi:hypothetical protein